MLRKSTLLIIVLLFGATLCFAGDEPSAREQQPSQTTQPAEQPMTTVDQPKELSGIVDKVDLTKKTISIKDEITNESTKYTFNDETSFSRNEKTAKASDFKKGDRVSLAVNSENLVLNLKTQAEESSMEPSEKEDKE